MDLLDTLSLSLLTVAVPIWALRTSAYWALPHREKCLIRRLMARREAPLGLGSKLFTAFIVVGGLSFAILHGLVFLAGNIQPWQDGFGAQVNSGLQALGTGTGGLLANQILPMKILSTAFILAVTLTVIITSLREIRLIHRLRRKTAPRRGLQSQSVWGQSGGGQSPATA
ncbi:hypothetical protein [Roseibium litorale]|uniref:Uncharacterized protein n=1 Tax=Roseibium litorale TaxID=2803841 RepID=A0ABR9CJU5_9HYPH|nr:hypothetical protein [Roseibium litorale]MBD8890680.1 hypothetical protein [Roseibium litorale]